ncbi:MAG: NAD-dependent DNA ligase LigA [Kiritimatiellae bacterium]|nr:NAD-dependent DNA ligase LigA [Kiritimatiellia bacterium]
MEASDEKIARMREWVARLNAAADAYYNGRGELMTDFEWDALFDQVKALERETGVTLPDSPTNKVSADDVAGQKEPHEFAALSLAKTKKVADVAKWAEGRPVWLSWKLDGLTLVVTWDGGKLTKVVTRGDGHVGTNVTHLAEGIGGIPKTVKAKGHLVVRGEAVISYADFEDFCASAQETYANPRNLASGSLTLKDVEELKLRKLRWAPFTLVHSDEPIDSWGARMDFLDACGLETVARERLDSPDEASIRAAVDRWTALVTSRANPFPVDGLVVCYDDVAYAQTGSVTGHHATRAGFAFKWQDETAETELDHVEWSCAVASITPVAVFKPVNLEGTVVKRASLCNVSECERLGLGGPGTGLSVIKANKIIPKVVAVTRKTGRFAVPAKCPVCGAPTATKVSDTGTKTLQCTNASCPARALRKFMRFVSKDGMDVDGLAGETLAKFVNRGWIRTFADVYRLGAHRDEIAAMEGFGAKSADKIAASVEQARTRGAVRFFVALSIPLCGPDVAKRLLAAHGGDAKALVAAAEAAGGDDLFASGDGAFAAIDGIGPGKSAAFVAWFRDPANRALVADLFGEVSLEQAPAAAAGGKCAGLTFVVTGDVHHYPNRAALKAYVESQGGKVAGSVSAKTDFLINNDVASTSGKNKKAQELGVPVISEDEFVARFAAALAL